jgi:hypothetical protein
MKPSTQHSTKFNPQVGLLQAPFLNFPSVVPLFQLRDGKSNKTRPFNSPAKYSMFILEDGGNKRAQYVHGEGRAKKKKKDFSPNHPTERQQLLAPPFASTVGNQRAASFSMPDCYNKQLV